MKRPTPPPNIVIKMGTFPPKPTTGWRWQHGRYTIPKTRMVQECPSCLMIEAGRVIGKAFGNAVKAIKEFSRSMEVLAERIKRDMNGLDGID